MEDSNQLVQLLRERKLKATPTRLEVLSAISGYNKAMPFSELQNALNNFDRVTLYRTIQALLDKGIIHKALIDDKDTFYAICNTSCSSETHHHEHIHFKCTSCQEVTCVQTLNPTALAIPGHMIENFKIEATGVCISCNN